MKIEELRIGNLLSDSKTNFIVEINMINSLHIQVGITRSEDKELYHLRLDELRPIPITEELLLKLGYEKSFDAWGGWLGPRFDAGSQRRIRNIEGRWQMLEAKLDFVHQLQNLHYALTGEELVLTQLKKEI